MEETSVVVRKLTGADAAAVQGVNARNEAAIALYERMGFTAFDHQPCFMLVDGIAHDEIHLVHVLRASE